MIGAPIAEDWEDWKTNESLVEYAEAFWFVGTVPLLKACSAINCVTEERYRWVKARMVGKCKSDCLRRKYSILRAIYSNLAIGSYFEAAKELAELVKICGNTACRCNC